ncbi:sulfotransferase [Sphingomonas sp. Leaf4]|uniref:sulfotransferase n=1 Tax=Sphingomonas sp. Leaf4 TaxID=2876553 RepID=UPI001E331589|nr:sulfotransferase [Sphingomonas sp. Leaf4]
MRVDVESSEAAMLARLRDAIDTDPALAARLAAIVDGHSFAIVAHAEAAAFGIDLSLAAIAAAIRPDPLGLERFALPLPTHHEWPAPAWLPVAVADGAAGPVVEWLHFAGRRLTEPFFEEAVRRARCLPLNRLRPVRTPLDRFAETMPAGAAFAPSGFVFHLSRCGSTLVAQMLAAVPDHVVASEPPPLDAIVQRASTGDAAARGIAVAQLRAMVAALLRDRHGDRRIGVVKLDCWHMLAWELFAEAFSDVPFLFLYRDPVEILVSHARRPGSQTVPGLIPHLAEDSDAAADPAMFGARLLGRIADAATDAVRARRAIAVRYDALPDAFFDRILPHFGIAVDDAGRTAMRAAGGRDAKAPTTRFIDDRAAKHVEATPELRGRAAALVTPAVARLDAAEAAR